PQWPARLPSLAIAGSLLLKHEPGGLGILGVQSDLHLELARFSHIFQLGIEELQIVLVDREVQRFALTWRKHHFLIMLQLLLGPDHGGRYITDVELDRGSARILALVFHVD